MAGDHTGAPGRRDALKLAAAAGLAGAAALAWAALARFGPSMAEGALGGAFALSDHHGRPATERMFLGRRTLITFGFTHCPDVCPLALWTIAEALSEVDAVETEESANATRGVFVTVDPARDTQALLAEYVGAFHPRIIGLRGAPTETARAARAFRVFHRRVPAPPGAPSEDYGIDHSAAIFLVDGSGAVVRRFRHDARPEALTAALRDRLDIV